MGCGVGVSHHLVILIGSLVVDGVVDASVVEVEADDVVVGFGVVVVVVVVVGIVVDVVLVVVLVVVVVVVLVVVVGSAMLVNTTNCTRKATHTLH